MKTNLFLNDMLTKGAILGGVMLLSGVAETAMLYYGGNTEWLTAMSIEVLVVMALYVYLAYRFTRNYANLVLAERKEMPYFSFGSGLSYIIGISMLAGVIASLGNWLFRHYVIGFEEYITANVKLIQDVLSQTEVPASAVSAYDEIFKALKSQSEPSLIKAVLSGVWTYLVSGTIVGLLVAGFTKREPKMFDEKNEE